MSSLPNYSEPQVSFLVLDFQKPDLTRECLLSLRRHVKVSHKVIYLHNGLAAHPMEFLANGLIDQLIMPRVNGGLGLGTRDLFAACFSPYAIYWQNDQIMGRDFEQRELDALIAALERPVLVSQRTRFVHSVSLAGAPCGPGVYSERAHFIETAFYREMEEFPLSYGGAGPYHHVQWREGQIQEFYERAGLWHLTDWPPLSVDRGIWNIRDCAGGRVKMRTDTKAVWWIIPPTAPYVFPEMTEAEWAAAIAGQWVGGTIPQAYLDKGQSFNCWGDATHD